MTRSSGERRERTISTLTILGIGALYAATSARYVLGGDNGELVAAAWSNGIAHPPGYPLFVLVLGLARIVPASSPAHAAALVTVAIATLSIAALAWAARRWGASRVTALAAAALYAATPLAWILGTHAEVFALNVLLAMGIVGLSAPNSPAPFGRESVRAFLLALFAGLGLSNHHTIVLLAPIGICGFVVAARRAGVGRGLALGALGLALGLLPYVSLMSRGAAVDPAQTCAWGAPRDLAGVVHHFLRRDYGTFSLGITGEGAAGSSAGAHVAALLKTLFVDLFGAPVVLVAALVMAWKKRPGASLFKAHVRLVLLVASLVLAGPVFVSRFNLPTHGIAVHITERFHLLPLALTAVLLALALDVVFVHFAISASRIAAGAACFFAARALGSYGRVVEHHRPTIDQYVRNVLAITPEHAIILHSGDDRVGAFMYARCALGLRRDVDAIAPVLLLTDWYPPQASARLGIPIVHGERAPGQDRPELATRALVDQLLATGRPLYVTDWFRTQLDKAYPSYPIGPIIRVPRDPHEIPDPLTLAKMNDDAFDKIVLEPTLPERDTWAGARLLDYARPWASLANAFAAAGDEPRADACRRRARALTP